MILGEFFKTSRIGAGKFKARLCVILLLLSGVALAQQNVEDLAVVALSPLDKSAVVRLSDQGMQVLKPGDAIRGTELRLTQVLTDKLVLEDRAAANRVIWLHRAVNGISAVEYPEMLQQ